ncbi:MAG: polysaccharide deacetylase family protein [Promethearchaeota archaeon]
MPIIPQYFKQLLKVYRRNIFYLLKKTVLNFFFQLTKMEYLINNINSVLEKYNSHMTYFVAAYILEGHPDRVAIFRNSKNIALPHGYKHFNLQELTVNQAIQEIRRSKEIFERSNLESWCFRAPYAMNSISNLGKSKFYEVLKEIGFSHSSSEFQEDPPWKPINQVVPEFVMARPSDDLLIDLLGIWNPRVITKHFIKSIRKTKGSIIIFDMHPIRMGQKKFIVALDAICKFVNKDANSILIEFKKAVETYRKDQKENFVCITGDIDTWSYIDYIRRLRK